VEVVFIYKEVLEMNDIVNLIINSSTSVVIIAYFIFRDYKWNNQLISTLTKIEDTLEDIKGYNYEDKRKGA
jgi:hypothetical protein